MTGKDKPSTSQMQPPQRRSGWDLSDPKYLLPLQRCWIREYVKSKRIYINYISPSNKKFTNRSQLKNELHSGLRIDHFTFCRRPLKINHKNSITRYARERAFRHTEEVKAGNSEHIILNVMGKENAFKYKMKKQTPLRKVMNDYCERVGLVMAAVRFRLEGKPINEVDTPLSLEMEEGDTIDAYQQWW